MQAALCCWAAAGLIGCGLLPGGARPKLLLIGIDGADWDLIEPLRARGQLPNLNRLIEQGVRAPLRAPEPLLSPLLWTTIATGRAPLDHGVTWFFSQDPEGRPIPVSGARRKVPAIWDVASAESREVAVIGWWATWPAERLRGVMVSDRVAAHGFGVGGARPAQALVYPPARAQELIRLLPDPKVFAPPELQPVLAGAPDQSADGTLTLPELLRAAASEVEGYGRIAAKLLKEGRFELVCVYFEGIDTVSHIFMPAAAPAQPHVDPQVAARYGDTVERFYRYQDRILGDLVAAAGPDTAVVVVSDHGFRSGERRLPPVPEGWQLERAHRDHRPDGILILSGPMFRKGVALRGPRLEQVASTVLYALDLPLEPQLERRVLEQAFLPEFLADQPRRTVAQYTQRKPPAIPSGSAGTEEEARRLRALGYVGTSEDLLSGEELNRASLLARAGQLEAAAGVLQALIDRDPKEPKAALALASIRLTQGRMAEARAALAIARSRAPKLADVDALEGKLLLLEGRLPEAEQRLQVALARDPDQVAARVELALVLLRGGAKERALEELQRARRLDPDNVDAWYNLGVVLEELGRPADARQAYATAVEIDPTHHRALNHVALSYQSEGNLEMAETLFRRALQVAPKDLVANVGLGMILLHTGRAAEAQRPLRIALQQRPDDPRLRQALAAAGAS